MPSLLKILLGTPYWVWVLFIYLIFVGVHALNNRTVSLFRLGIMPIVFIAWSLSSLYSKTALPLTVWILFCCMGIFVGYYMMSRLNISIDKNTKLINLPGSFISLILSCVFFLIKYCLGVSYALDPDLQANVVIIGLGAALSGAISGISLGRFFNILHKYRAVFHY